MGQQQVLLAILVTVILGIATIVAINTLQASHERSNIDAVRQQVLSSYNYALAYYRKPQSLGGGSRSFNGMTMSSINLPDSTADGKYSLVLIEGDTQSFQIIVTPNFDREPITFTLTPTSVTSDLD